MMKENIVVDRKRYYGGRPNRERWEMMADFVTDLKNTKIYPEEIEYLRAHFYSKKYYFKGKKDKVEQHIERFLWVAAGNTGASIARAHGVTNTAVGVSVVKCARRLNQLVSTMPEYKTTQLLEGEYCYA